MTRKHFEAIAKAFRQRYENADPRAIEELGYLADDLGNVLAEFNPQFDHQRFVSACLGERS